MNPLTLIGYWHSQAEPHWPDPAWFVDSDWDLAIRARVLAHLRGGTVPWAFGGSSWCRFRCETKRVGSVERTDGRFVWPEGLAHYVERHAVRVPDEFVMHVLAYIASPTSDVLSAETPIATAWWAEQRGFRSGSSFLSPAPCGRFIAHAGGVEPTPAVLRALRRHAAVQALSLPDLTEIVRADGAVVLIGDAYEHPRPAELAELEALGLTVTFEPKDSAD